MGPLDDHFEKANLLEKDKINYHDELMVIQENNGLLSNKLDLGYTEFWTNLENVNPDDYKHYLTYKALYEHEKNYGEVKFDEPMMYIHGVSKDFESFGEINNRDLEPYKYANVIYTVAIPEETGLKTFSDKYESDKYVHPLHHIEKNELVDKDTYSKLEKSWVDVLSNEENTYVNSIASNLVAQVYASEKQQSSYQFQPEKRMKKPSKTNNFEMER